MFIYDDIVCEVALSFLTPSMYDKSGVSVHVCDMTLSPLTPGSRNFSGSSSFVHNNEWGLSAFSPFLNPPGTSNEAFH